MAYISNTMNGTVSVLDPATQKIVADITMPRVGPRLPFPAFLAATPDGTKLYVSNLNTDSVSVVDTRRNLLLKRIDIGHAPQLLSVTPDGERLLVANDGTAIVVIDTEKDEVDGQIPIGTLTIGAAASQDNEHAWFSTPNGLVEVDLDAKNVVGKIDDVGAASPLLFDASGKTLYALGNYHPRGRVSAIDVSTRQVTATYEVESSPVAAALTPDGKWLYVANRGANTVSAIDLTQGAVVARIKVGSVPTSVAVTPDGASVYIADSMSNTLSVISTATQAVAATVDLNPPAQARPANLVIVPVP